jgi:hypothetical protein
MILAIQTALLPELEAPIVPKLSPSDFRRLVWMRWEWPDKVTAEHAGRLPHRVYEVRRELGRKKYRNDGFVRSSRKSSGKRPRKCTPVKVSSPTGERFDLSGHVRDVLRFEMR